MANYSNLKAAIADVIKTNGTKAITGQVLQHTLNSIVSVIGANYQFAGVATPSTNPGTPDQNVFYVAMQGGTYTNFNATALPDGISLLMWNGSWSSQVISYNDGGVFDISVYKSTGGTLATFADLAAALGTNGANVPVAARKGGMSVRFVQSSDNKYVQYRLMSQTFSTNVLDWWDENIKPNPFFINAPSLTYQRVKELYLTGLDSTKRYYFKYLRGLNTYNQIRLYSFTQDNKSDEVHVASVDVPDMYVQHGLIRLVPEDNSGVSGYAVIDIEYSETQNVSPEINLDACTCIAYSPTIKGIFSIQLIDNKFDTKLDKEIGTNIVDYDNMTSGVVISWSDGNIATGFAAKYKVSDYIPINGNNIISDAYYTSGYYAAMVVYDKYKTKLRVIQNSKSYTYDQQNYPDDYYVRISFNSEEKEGFRANYGTTLLPYEEYTDKEWFTEVNNKVQSIDKEVDIIADVQNENIGQNLVDYQKVIHGKIISWNSGNISTTSSLEYSITDYIRINKKDIICNAFYYQGYYSAGNVYDKEKNLLRTLNGTNQYLYDETNHPDDYYVRFSIKADDIRNFKANYGTTLLPYEPYTNDKQLTSYEHCFFSSIALFEKIAVVGDSYSAGAVYDVPGMDSSHYGRHNGMAWLSIMGRKNGCESNLYAAPGKTTKEWLEDTSENGLAGLLADNPSNLYFIMMGINDISRGTVTKGSVADCNVDWTQNEDTFCGNYGKIIGNIKTHAPNARIICIGLCPFSGWNDAIKDVADFYGVAYFDSNDDSFFQSSFYRDNMQNGHPTGITYAGMATAFERLTVKCMQNYISYFQIYWGND